MPTETEEVVEPAGTDVESEDNALPFKTRAEMDSHIEKEAAKRATSIANKSTITYQRDLEGLKSQLRKASETKEDDALSRLEKKQQDLYGGEDELPDFLEAQKELAKQVRAFKKEKGDWEDKHDKVSRNVKEQQAFTKALELYLVPEDSEDFFSTVREFANKLAEAGSDREQDLLVALEEEKLQRRAEAAPKARGAKPDSGVPTAPGGMDLNKLSARELIKLGVKQRSK